jgi:hypothetical protein
MSTPTMFDLPNIFDAIGELKAFERLRRTIYQPKRR